MGANDKKPQRKSKLVTLAEAGRMISGCKTISFSGATIQGAPMALIRAAIRAGAKELTLIPHFSTGIPADLLVAAGCVHTYYNSYTGLEFLGFAPAFRKAGESGSINIIQSDEAFSYLGIKAAAAGLPFMSVQQLYEGTDLPKINPLLRTIRDPYSGKEVFTIPSLKLDVFLLHVQRADEFGNCQIWGGTRMYDDWVKAANKVIVSTDEIMPLEKTKQEPDRTTYTGWMVDAVVHVPYGAHPTSSPGLYTYDEDHLRLYRDLVAGDRGKEYLSKFVLEPKDHYEYLELIGLRKLLGLQCVV
jgi:glutaconate CoA-transferase subunit A